MKLFNCCKREKILKSGLELFVSQGFHGTPTSQIAKHAGVANGTLFHYFPSKEDLIVSIYIDAKREYFEQIKKGLILQKSSKAKVKHWFVETLSWGITRKNEYSYCHLYNCSPFVSDEAKKETDSHAEALKTVYQEAIDKGIIKNIDIKLIIHSVLGYIYGVVNHLKENNDLVGDADFYEMVFDLYWDMIKKV